MSQNSGKHSESAGERGAAKLTVPAAREIVRKMIGDEGGISAMITPAFPARWPAEAHGHVVYFVYTSSALPTSMNLRQVYSPYLRIELPLTSTVPIQPDIHKLEPRKIDPAENAGSRSSSVESLDKAQEALLGTVGLPRPETAAQIRQPYLDWLHDHAALADEIKRSFPAFFAWLMEK